MNNSTLPIVAGSQDNSHIAAVSILRIVVYCIIFVLGVLGNAFVLVALKRKKRKTANDWFIVNLTIADVVLIVCLISDIYVELADSPFDIFFCKVMRPLSTLVYFVGIFTITAMALERHQVLTKPFHLKMEQRCALLVIGALWVLAVVLVIPLPIVTSPGASECEEQWPSITYRRIFTVGLAVVQYLFPLAIIIVAYIRIVIYLWNERTSQQEHNIPSDVLRRARKDNIQVVKAVIIVVIFFAMCMLPNQLAWLLLEFGKAEHQKIAEKLLKFSPLLNYLHSCANPIIYGTFLTHFRNELKAWLMKCSACCLGPYFIFSKRICFEPHSIYREPHQHFKYVPGRNITSNEDREELGVRKHGEHVATSIGGQINVGFIKSEYLENGLGFDETRL